jgi:hypothetical protein
LASSLFLRYNLLPTLTSDDSAISIVDASMQSKAESLEFGTSRDASTTKEGALAFISYSRAQFYWAESIAFALRQKGVRVWFDTQHLLSGTDWEKGIQQGLQSSSELILIASPAALASDYVKQEWRTASAAGKRILVLLVETVDLPPELNDPEISLIDCRADFDRGVELLTAGLTKGTVHRDTILRTPRVPRDVAVVEQSLLWSGLYAMSAAILVVLDFGMSNGIDRRNAITLASMFGCIVFLGGARALLVRRSFVRRHFETQELALVAFITPIFAAMAIGFLMYLRPAFGMSEIPYVFAAALGVALGILAVYVAWLLTRSSDIYRWAATGEVSEDLRRRQMKVLPPAISWEHELIHPYQLHYVAADRLVAEQVEEALGKPPAFLRNENPITRILARLSMIWQSAEDAEGSDRSQQRSQDISGQLSQMVQIVILSNKSPIAWVRKLATQHERLITVAASSIAIPKDLHGLSKLQWVDLRKRNEDQLAPLNLFLRGAPDDYGYNLDVVPEGLARPVWPTPIGVGAKILQLGAGGLIAVFIIEAAALLLGGSRNFSPVELALLFVSTLLQVWIVGITLDRRVGIGIVGTATVVSLALLAMAVAGDFGVILKGAWFPLLFLAFVYSEQWLPISTSQVSVGPTLAINSWPIWSRNLFWVGVPVVLICTPFVPAIVEKAAVEPVGISSAADDSDLRNQPFLRGDAILQKVEADAKARKSKLPEKVDDITTLVDLKFEPTEMTQWHVVDLSKYCCKTFDPHELEQRMQQEMQQEVCAKPDAAHLVKQGYRYTFHYVNKGGLPLADFTITTCP